MPSFRTVFEAFESSCSRWGSRPFLALTRTLNGGDQALDFDTVRSRSLHWSERLRAAGYGPRHRIAISVGNRPEHFVLQLALNAIGVSAVPINPDLTTDELAYVLDHSEAILVITDAVRAPAIARAILVLTRPVAVMSDQDEHCPVATEPCDAGIVDERTEASLLYTSGTTGRPKGCMLSNAYYFRIGRAYAEAGGAATVRPGLERILNPLPVYHQNAGIFSFMCALLSGGCVLMTDRFHASTWWQEVVESRATIIHYLGVMPAILLKMPAAPFEAVQRVRFGIGAGVEPSLHALFEARFGFPLIELWGMTETGCGFIASSVTREVGTRAVGRPRPGHSDDLEVRLVDDEDRDVAPGAIGELLVRRPGPDPRQGMFSGYLKDEAATEEAWKGGWFRTGDAFWQDVQGVLHFAERKKNIVRRSGENIAAAEVEAVLLQHADVAQVAVIAVRDEIREEEVMACVVGARAGDDKRLSCELFALCMERLAYYKAPGWFVFLDAIPVTSTQKVQKARIFLPGYDARTHPRAIDMRSAKKRPPARS